MIVVGLLVTLIMSFVLCCCGKRLKNRRNGPYSGGRRLFYSFLFLVGCVFISVGSGFGLRSSGYLTTALDNIIKGISASVTDMISLTEGLAPVVVSAVVTLSDTLDSTIIDVVANVTAGYKNDVALNVSMTNASAALVVQADFIDAVLLSGTDTDLAIKTFIDYVYELQIQAANLSTQLSNLNAPITETGNTGTFEIVNKFPIPSELNSSTLLGNILSGSIPNVTAKLDDLRVPNIPDLRAISIELLDKYNSLPNTISGLLSGNNSGISFLIKSMFLFFRVR